MNINNNMTAVIAGNYLMRSEKSLQSSTERLSSGYKLNAAKDDPAGYAISSYMRTQLKALSKANDNANNGISVIETAEGTVAEIQDMIHRLNELAIHAATGTMSDNDRKAVQAEVDALTEEIDRMSEDADFNTMKLLNGNLENKGYTNDVDIKVQYYSDYTKCGKYQITLVPVDDGNGNYLLDTNGNYAGYTIAPGTTIDAVDDNGVLISPPKYLTDNPSVSFFETKGYTDNASVKVESYGVGTKLGDYTFTIKQNALGEFTIDPDDEGIKKLTSEETTITYDGNNGNSDIIITATDGTELRLRIDDPANFTVPQNVKVDLVGLGVMEEGNHMIISSNDGTEVHLKIGEDAFVDKTVNPPTTPPTLLTSKTIIFDLTGMGAMRLQIGANEGQILELSIPEISLEKLGIENLDCTTQESARNAIRRLDYALSYTNTIRSKLGAYQNRLDHAIASLDITEENLTGSYSRIIDADMAEEMTEYTRLQVMQQAGTTMLAQANEYPQKALQLLQ